MVNLSDFRKQVAGELKVAKQEGVKVVASILADLNAVEITAGDLSVQITNLKAHKDNKINSIAGLMKHLKDLQRLLDDSHLKITEWKKLFDFMKGQVKVVPPSQFHAAQVALKKELTDVEEIIASVDIACNDVWKIIDADFVVKTRINADLAKLTETLEDLREKVNLI